MSVSMCMYVYVHPAIHPHLVSLSKKIHNLALNRNFTGSIYSFCYEKWVIGRIYYGGKQSQ